MDEKTQPAAADTPAAAAAMPAAKKIGRQDPAYLRDQAEQRRADTRFDSSRFQRKQEAGSAPKYTR